jgi:CRP-like cAMP-binding protein
VGQHVEHLQQMHPHLRRMVYAAMHHVNVKEGHLVIKQGEPSDAWYILLRGSLQCIASSGAMHLVPKQYAADRQHAEMQNIEKETNTERRLAKHMDQMQNLADAEILGEEVSYYFGHGKHIKGLVVGVFHPGDSFGESAFEYAEESVTHRLRKEILGEDNQDTEDKDGDEDGDDDGDGDGDGDGDKEQSGRKRSNSMAPQVALDHYHHESSAFAKHPHDYDQRTCDVPESLPPAQTTRTASVVALESAELLKGNYTHVKMMMMQWWY